MNVVFSVLVAVYNAEPYLRRCLDSLRNQTLREIQIICVDDASTDASLAILHEYAKADSRIEVHHLHENRGQAHARNVALGYARGQFITFLDSDDWMATDALQCCADAFFTDADDVDAVLFKVYYAFSDGRQEIYATQTDPMSGEEAFRLSLTWKIHGWYAIRQAIHKKYPYDETCKSYSDDNTTRIHYLHCRKVAFCDGTYYYWQNQQSVTHAVGARRFDRLRANESMKRQLIEENVSEADLNEFETVRMLVLVDSYYFYYQNRRKMTKQTRQFALSEMRRVWGNIEKERVKPKLRRHFGYCLLRPSWLLFRAQEETYFFLRKLFHKN